MRKLITLFFVILSYTNAAYLQESTWKNGETFLTFLENNSLPLKIYYNLDGGDKELTAEIISGIKFQILRSDNGKVEQVLIPIGDELQLHIKKIDGKYILTTTPIVYEEKNEILSIDITNSPYQDIIKATKNYLLASEFINSFKNSVNFKRLRNGDKLVILYSQKTRLGKQFGSPIIKASMVEVRGKKHYVFLYNKHIYYNAKGKEIDGFFLKVPLRYTRISSVFTYKRWHPILHRFRAHLGIDYAAPEGTPIKAAGDGKIIFEGRKGGYGNAIIIRHAGGYRTLYAHMEKYRRGIRRGRYVKQGQVIGYVGSTGLSTGPHLHFGLYKGLRAINPASMVKLVKSALVGKKRKDFLKYAAKYKKKIELVMLSKQEPKIEKNFDYIVSLQTKNHLVE